MMIVIKVVPQIIKSTFDKLYELGIRFRFESNGSQFFIYDIESIRYDVENSNGKLLTIFVANAGNALNEVSVAIDNVLFLQTGR